MRKRVRNQKLHPWPAVYKRGENHSVSFQILTPLRLQFYQHTILEPLRIIWGLMLTLMLLDFILTALKIWTLSDYVSFQADMVYKGLIGGLVLWHIEHISGFALGRVLGRRVRVTIKPDKIIIRNLFFGLLGKSYSRENDLFMFVKSELGQATQNPIYQNSAGILITIGDSCQIPICEAFDLQRITKIVTNLNTALLLEQIDNERDVDYSQKLT